ncbi:MAG TPA: translocation/assembly module TamB domain-containing protein, partial [Rhodothermia bacterium]|nr:translocation/assembly module TamB domain-containing protein [Rhodothermia bacterium]
LKELEGSEPVQLEVKSDSIPLAWVRPFLDQRDIDRIEGYLVSDVQIGGTWDDPALSGRASVNGGRARLPEFNLDMRSVSGTFRLDGNQLLVDELNAISSGGTLAADGSLGFRSLDDPTFDLDATFDKFRAITTETYQVTVTGTGRLTGSMINPVFDGRVRMEESDIFMTEELMADEIDPVRLTERDLRVLERRFGYRVAAEDTSQWIFYEALDLTLEVRIGRDVWFRSSANPKMDVEFSGDLTVSKKPHADQVVSGTISVNPSRSRVVSFARRFDITTGEIQFNGVVDEALVNIHAEYVVPSRFGGDEVKIKLEITGQFADMRLNLTSEPPMDTGAMVSYLTTGRPPGEASVGGTQAAELAVSSLSNLVEGFANSELGLDLVEIQINPTGGTSLTVGKYVSPKVYVSLTQPVVSNDAYQSGHSTHQTAMAIEYELVTWLVAQLASSRNQLQVNLIWEVSF